jgi:acetyl esterase
MSSFAAMRVTNFSIAFLVLLTCAGALSAGTLKDIEYANKNSESLRLDAAIPDGAGPFPAAILVHGGGWIAGDKQQYITYIFEPLSKAGFAWFSINYRLAPKYRFPAAMEDVEDAIRWLKTHAAEYRVDPFRIALIGESAGGHIVSWVGANYKSDTRVAAVVSFYGVHDVITRAIQQQGKIDEIGLFFDVDRLDAVTAPLLARGSPVTYIKRDMPPYLMIHGTEDQGVPFEQSVEMCNKMSHAGASCEIVSVSAGHGMDTWEPHPELLGYKEKMVQWLRARFRQ